MSIWLVLGALLAVACVLLVARPFLRVISASARFVLRRFGAHEVRSSVVHSPEELKLIVTASRRFGIVPQLEEEMIQHALELGEITVRQVMVPRPRIFSLPADMPLETALARVVEEQQVSRLLAPQVVSAGQHLFDNISVSDFGAQQFNPKISHRDLQAEVAHHRSHNGFLLEGSLLVHVLRTHRQDLITVQYVPGFIDEQRAVRVAEGGPLTAVDEVEDIAPGTTKTLTVKLEPGKYADLIVVNGDPLKDLRVFQNPDNLRLIMKGGAVFKRTL